MKTIYVITYQTGRDINIIKYEIYYVIFNLPEKIKRKKKLIYRDFQE